MSADTRLDHVADFTTTPRIVPIASLAVAIAAYLAWALLKLIGFFTNLSFFQRIGTALVYPDEPLRVIPNLDSVTAGTGVSSDEREEQRRDRPGTAEGRRAH